MNFSKPVIAAVEGHAVAGGLELALMCDLRAAGRSAGFGVFCRRWGVPLIDGGTVRLPRLIGQAQALDLILTGRAVAADEALAFGLVNRVVDDGLALTEAQALARQIAAFPPVGLQARPGLGTGAVGLAAGRGAAARWGRCSCRASGRRPGRPGALCGRRRATWGCCGWWLTPKPSATACHGRRSAHRATRPVWPDPPTPPRSRG